MATILAALGDVFDDQRVIGDAVRSTASVAAAWWARSSTAHITCD
jgi:hypothetical protein